MDKAVRLSLAEAGNRYTSSKRETDRLIKKEIEREQERTVKRRRWRDGQRSKTKMD